MGRQGRPNPLETGAQKFKVQRPSARVVGVGLGDAEKEKKSEERSAAVGLQPLRSRSPLSLVDEVTQISQGRLAKVMSQVKERPRDVNTCDLSHLFEWPSH